MSLSYYWLITQTKLQRLQITITQPQVPFQDLAIQTEKF